MSNDPGPHTLLVADGPVDGCARTARWVDEQLHDGAKVFHTGRSCAARDWLIGDDGAPRARQALSSGQLVVSDVATVWERSGGTAAGVRAFLAGEVARAVTDEGWPCVAISQDSPGLPVVDDAGLLDYLAGEAGVDELAARHPLRRLCRLTVASECRAAVWETAALHHRDIEDRHWGARWDGERWRVHGELDAHAVPRFGAALHGALRARRTAPSGPDLAVDLSAVGFLDFAGAQSLTLAARAAGRGQRMVLHGTSAFARRIIEVADRPAGLHIADRPDEGPGAGG